MFLLYYFIIVSSIQPAALKFDFGSKGVGEDWVIINDDVMGGLSQASVDVVELCYIFRGEVSLQNNGGFASFRSPVGRYNLQKYKTMRIRYKSIDRDFGVVLEDQMQYYLPYHKIICQASTDGWKTSEFELSHFKKYILGRETGGKIGVSELSNIKRLGVVINDENDGPFEIAIDYIEFF